MFSFLLSATRPNRKSLSLSLLNPSPLPWEVLPRKLAQPEPNIVLPSSSILDELLNDIEQEVKESNNGSLPMNDTEIVIFGNGKTAFRIIDEEHQIVKVNVTILVSCKEFDFKYEGFESDRWPFHYDT